jgi:hypothetical protein
LIVSVIALVAALAGTASALPGTDTVSKNDIKKNAVGGAQIVRDAVKSSDLADGKIKAQDLEGSEAFHRVGAAGEPAFATGGEGDCVWGASAIALAGLNPVSFYRDPFDVVHLVGATNSSDAPGGDGVCDPADPGEAEDAIIFVLPAGYRPENLQFAGSGVVTSLVVPDEGAVINGQNIEPGAVLPLFGAGAVLDNGVFRAAGDGTGAIDASAPARLGSLESLRKAVH